MLPRNGERPPPRFADDDLSNEQPTKTLDNGFNARRPPPQGAPRIPRERLLYLAGRLHSLGPRPLFEFLREIEAGAPLHERLERYAALEPLADFIQSLGGDRLPPPARLIRGRRA